MLTENKIGKYLIYAIGEITLVMIGILLALQVNNWNEVRKQQETLNAIYLITKEDLNHDIAEIDSFITDYEEIKKPAFEALINAKITKENWINKPQYKTIVLGGFKDFTINQRGFELLRSQSNLSMNMEKDLISKVNIFYNKHNAEIDVALLQLGGESSNNLKSLKKYDWFSSFLLHGEMDGAIDYISNNPISKNNISLFYVLYKIYVDELSNFKTNGKELIRQIDSHFKNQ